jgi:hypothetical protein
MQVLLVYPSLSRVPAAGRWAVYGRPPPKMVGERAAPAGPKTGATALGLDTAGNLNALSASAGLVRHQDDATAATGDETAAEGAGIGPVKGFSALLAGQGHN